MHKPPDSAYYYPAPYWGYRDSEWVKSLLLFLDEVSILLPGTMCGQLSRVAGTGRGLELHPVTNHRPAAHELAATLSRKG